MWVGVCAGRGGALCEDGGMFRGFFGGGKGESEGCVNNWTGVHDGNAFEPEA